MMYRFEFKGGESFKFWEVGVDKNTLTTRWGKIGSDGQSVTKTFSSPQKAVTEQMKLVRQKLSEGYKPMFDIEAPESTLPSVALYQTCIGEHIEDVAEDICSWLNCCLWSNVTPKTFAKIWDKLLEGGDEDFEESLCWTRGDDPEDWFDHLTVEDDDIDKIYKKAFKGKAQRFITFNRDAYISIVAVIGMPKARDIAVLCLGGEEGVGEWTPVNTRQCLGADYPTT